MAANRNTWHVTPYIFLQIFHISLITRCHIANCPQIHLFLYIHLYLLQKSIMVRLRPCPDEEIRRKFFGMILYVHFLYLYRRNFLIRTGGDQINCTVQRKLDRYTCYSKKPYNIALTGFEFLHLLSCIWTLLEQHLLKAEKKGKTAPYGGALQKPHDKGQSPPV